MCIKKLIKNKAKYAIKLEGNNLNMAKIYIFFFSLILIILILNFKSASDSYQCLCKLKVSANILWTGGLAEKHQWAEKKK